MRRSQTQDHVLATVLCIAVEASGVSNPDHFRGLVRHEAELFRAGNMTVAQGNILLTFDGPARAVHAASSVVGLASRLGLDIRCGADTGMCQIDGTCVVGVAAERATEVARLASFGEVLVSDAVMSLISGSGLVLVEAFPVDGPTKYSIYRLIS